MSRRMIDPQTIIKSHIVDDKNVIDLNELLEKYGRVLYGGEVTTITLQFYNQFASDEGLNALSVNENYIGSVFINGSITITKSDSGSIFIQGMLINTVDNSIISYLEIESGSYENGIICQCANEFDVHVIKV